MSITAYFASLSLLKLVKNLPGGVAQGLIWGLMALGVYITFRLLDVADLTVDGSFTTGGAVTVMLILAGVPAWAALLVAVIAGMLAGLCTGLLHTKLGIPAILAGILTQFSLYSINLCIMGMAAARCSRAAASGRKNTRRVWVRMVACTSAGPMPTFCRMRKRSRSSQPSLTCL